MKTKLFFSIAVILACWLAAFSPGCKKGATGNEAAAGSGNKAEFTVDKLYERGPVQFRIKIDKTEITIAEKIRMVLESTSNKKYLTAFPELVGQLGQFSIAETEILPARAIDKDNIRMVQNYVLRPFLSGDYKIPPLTFKYWEENETEDNAHLIETEEISVKVKSLLPEDMEKLELKDMAGPVEPPAPNMTWIVLLGCGILAVAGGTTGLVIWLYKRRVRMITASYIPAHELAFRQLQALVDKKHIDNGEYKLFYDGVSDILRYYIENRFGLHAPESTTEEFLIDIKYSEELDARNKDLLKEFLKHCDLVKFAELIPTTAEIQRAFDLCKNFIEETQDRTSQIEDKDTEYEENR